jgi:hypothetical protein
MLQTAGLKANPVMFSTRDNGTALPIFPSVSKYNSVLSCVETEGKLILLDATSNISPFGVIPPNDINGKGRLVNNLNGDWVSLESGDKYKLLKVNSLEISPDGKSTGLMIGNYAGYAGIEFRSMLGNKRNQENLIRKMQENIKGLNITHYSFSNVEDIEKPVTDSLNVEIMDNAELVGDKILFYPLLYDRIEKNRYTLEERMYPVDYNFPVSETYINEFTVPSGYEVESVPKSISLVLPDKSISVSFTFQVEDNKITVLYKRLINKILFLPDEYIGIKELYDEIVKKESEQVILKKVG